jgi:hypothetical protein
VSIGVVTGENIAGDTGETGGGGADGGGGVGSGLESTDDRSCASPG